jgi:hypothetical protein
MPNFLSDATIRRFLRARNWSAGQAAKSLKEAASWRRQYQPEKICWVNNIPFLTLPLVTAKKKRNFVLITLSHSERPMLLFGTTQF